MMVALPDHQLYYTEQDPEWIREEYGMIAPKYALERDTNHGELSDAARQLGALVIDSDKFAQYHAGFTDALWVIWWIGQTWAVEYKMPGEQLSKGQEEFRQRWEQAGGIHVTVRSVDDVEKALRRGV